MSFCRSLEEVRHPPSNLTVGNAGNSSRGRPSSRNLERPHSIVTRCSPEAVRRMAALGSSRTISTSLRAGSVIAPSWSTDADTVVLTEMSRSVPERRMPSFVASRRMLDRMGSVVLAGTLAATATRPSWSCSRVIVSFMPLLEEEIAVLLFYLIILSSSSRGSGNVGRRCNVTGLPCLPVRLRVDTVWGMGTFTPLCPRSSRVPTTQPHARGLFCAQLLARVLHTLAERAIARHLPAHLVHAVNHRGVVAAAERLADLDQLHLEQFAREIHRDLSRHGERLDARLRAKPLGRDTPATGHDFLDLVDRGQRLGRGHAILARADPVAQGLAGQLDGHFLVLERGEQQQLDDAPLQLPHVGAHVLGNEPQHVVRDGELEMVLLLLLPENGDAVLEVGLADVGHHAPLEPAHQPGLEARDLLGRPVGGEHDLLVALVQRVKRMEELLLRHFLAFEEMH